MNKRLLIASLALVFSGFSTTLFARADAEAGKSHAAACASCHGPEGNSIVGSFPKLAQQHSSYLIQQLNAFKSGARKNPIMSGIAMSLDEQAIKDIAAYYAGQKIAANPEPTLPNNDDDDEEAAAPEQAVKPKTMLELLAQGADLYRNGDLAREVSACVACHGPSGDGNLPAAFPLIKSQQPDYLIKTLNDFKSGARTSNPENIMRMIAKKMTEEEIKAVSYRISTMK